VTGAALTCPSPGRVKAPRSEARSSKAGLFRVPSASARRPPPSVLVLATVLACSGEVGTNVFTASRLLGLRPVFFHSVETSSLSVIGSAAWLLAIDWPNLSSIRFREARTISWGKPAALPHVCKEHRGACHTLQRASSSGRKSRRDRANQSLPDSHSLCTCNLLRKPAPGAKALQQHRPRVHASRSSPFRR
jgi:hypothetical protein